MKKIQKGLLLFGAFFLTVAGEIKAVSDLRAPLSKDPNRTHYFQEDRFLKCPAAITIGDLRTIKNKGRVMINGHTFVAVDPAALEDSIPRRIQFKDSDRAELIKGTAVDALNHTPICQYKYVTKIREKEFSFSIRNLGPSVGTIQLD